MDCDKLYLITGGTGHLGSALVSFLLSRHQHVRILILPGEEKLVPEGVEYCVGDVRDPAIGDSFFQNDSCKHVALIHCAGLITISSKENPAVWDVNVNGTENILHLAYANHVDRAIYVSSVHAIPEKPKGEVISEVNEFAPSLLKGQYAKSKAAATVLALSYAKKGLPVSVVHPSGIIGPGDHMNNNHMTRTLEMMASGRIPVSIQGGYDFVDVRDAAEGILACEQYGRSGECYILNGHYVSVKELLSIVRSLNHKKDIPIELPYWAASLIAPAAEKISNLSGDRNPVLTPYSIYTLQTNGLFSHQKAEREFGYHPKELIDTIRDTLES